MISAGTEWENQTKSEVPAVYREQLGRTNFPMEKVRALMQLRPARILLDLGVTGCSLVAVPLVLWAVPHPVTFLLCFILSICTFNRFAQLVHTSDHGGLFANPTLNRVVGNLCAYCLGYTRTGHRLAHLKHHQYLNTEKDPDRIWGAPDQSTRELVRRWVRDLAFVSAFERMLQYWQSDSGRFSVAPWKKLSLDFLLRGLLSMYPVVLTQAAIIALYTALLGPVYYLVLYVLPIMTVYPAQIRLRSTVEHSFDVGYRPATPQDVWVARSTLGNVVERFVFSPLAIHYHFEHHLFPGLPHYNLAKVHRLLVDVGFPVPVTPGYLAFVFRKMRAEKLAVVSSQEA